MRKLRSGGKFAHKNIVGQRIREARRNRRPPVTQAELTARLEVLGVHLNRAGVSKIETGRRTVTDFELKGIAEALRVPVVWLLGD